MNWQTSSEPSEEQEKRSSKFYINTSKIGILQYFYFLSVVTEYIHIVSVDYFHILTTL